jgi:hypothetical protein
MLTTWYGIYILYEIKLGDSQMWIYYFYKNWCTVINLGKRGGGYESFGKIPWKVPVKVGITRLAT